MKPLPDSAVLAYALRHPINRFQAESDRHGLRAPDAYTRAVVVLRMLVGEGRWSDGYERALDDCFEMNDGDQVVGHLLRMADADVLLLALLEGHASVGPRQLALWRESRRPVPHPCGAVQPRDHSLPVDAFNRALARAHAFHVDADLFPFDDSTEVCSIDDSMPDEAVVLRSPACAVAVTAGAVRAAELSANTLRLPGGTRLGFYASLPLDPA